MKLLPFDYAVRNLWRSPFRLVLRVLSGALVVLLVVAAASFVTGMSKSLVSNTSNSNVILMSVGSEESLERSQISGSAAGIVAASLPGVKTRLGVQFVSPEINAAILVKDRKDAKQDRHALVRGITDKAYLVHSRVSIVEGRPPIPGNEEIVVGSLAAAMMGVPGERLAPGNSLWFDNRQWKIVGRFSAPGSVLDCEIWVPLTDLQVATKRETVSGIVATLEDAGFSDVDVFTKQRFDLSLAAMTEADYYSSIMAFFQPVRVMVWATALLIAMTGLFGGLNTTYAAMAARVRELGMLQSLGFSRAAILISLMQESLLTAAAGVLVGSLVGLAVLDGRAVRFSMGVFELTVDSQVLLVGAAAGLIMGIVGALPPAWKCMRLPITEALKGA